MPNKLHCVKKCNTYFNPQTRVLHIMHRFDSLKNKCDSSCQQKKKKLLRNEGNEK